MENWKVVTEEDSTLGVYKINEYATIPTFATKGSACFDVYTSLASHKEITSYNHAHSEVVKLKVEEDSVKVYRGFRVMIPTGIIFDIPKGYSVRLHPRSGLALKNGVTLVNQEAIIDSDYVQETFVLIENTSMVLFEVTHGMRICQGELVKNVETQLKETFLPPIEKERKGGFGSTGTK